MASYAPLVSNMSAEFQDVKSVGVIGAGVAGLQMARACKAYGLQVTVFEKAAAVGGLWVENYCSYGVQVPKQLYEFPDFPFEAVEWGVYPTGAQTSKYIQDYADHFKLMQHVKLGTAVTALEPRKDGKPGWTFVYGSSQRMDFDFAVIATGMYSTPINMPTLQGTNSWGGEIIHSSQYTNQSIAKGKKVVVLGGCKSAIDITVDVSKVASAPPTMVFRNAHWPTPRLIAGLIPFQYVFLSRFGQALVSWYKGAWPAGASCYCNICAWMLFPIMWLAFRLVELIFALQRWCFGQYWPSLDVVADFYGYAHVTDLEYVRKRQAGELKAVRGEVARIQHGSSSREVVLTSGESIEADLIICATGFQKTYDYLPAATKAELRPEEDGLYLYRHMLPPAVRKLRLAFCGSEVASISNIMTHGLHAEYLCRVMKNLLPLPTEEVMKEEVETMKAWKRHWMPQTGSRASLVLLHQTHYHDQLLRDMGESPGRKCWFLSELFCPYEPMDYNGIIGALAAQGP